MVINKIEHHKNSQELIIPLDNPSILIVAPAGALNREEIINNMRAYFFDGSKIVLLDKGVRHFIPYPVKVDAGFYIIFAEDTGKNDLYFDDLKTDIIINSIDPCLKESPSI
jgi:ureidoglycolate hydrolase